MNPKDLFTLILVAFGVIIMLLIFNLMALVNLHGSTECHMTTMTSQVCEYR